MADRHKWQVDDTEPPRVTYTIGFYKQNSQKIFLYFTKSKEMSQQTINMMASEIPKCRPRHGNTDFIIHSDVGEFQS